MEDRSKSHEQSVPLTFGAIISISSLTNLDSFIYIDGFVEDKALAKQFTKNNNPKLIYSKTLFQIYPQSINTNKKRALQKKQELISESLRIHQQGAVGDPENKKIDEISELQESILTEFKINLENFKKTTGQPVLFGQPIQLLHVASNKFLSYRKTEARLERQNYKVGLDEYSNESTSFRFLPCYKHQEDSEGTVFLHDHVFIASVNSILNKVPYLHFSNPISTKEKRQKLNPLNGEGSPERGQATDRKEGAVKKTKVEVNVSLESRTKMKVNLYSNYVDIENNYLECGDIVWLNHSELAVTLVCVTEFKDNNFKFKVDFDGNRVTDQFKQFIGNTNGMWVIEKVPINEKQAYQDGGFVEWNETYRFKHLGSGLYLTVKKTRRKNEQQAENRIVLEAETNEDNEFVFIPIASNIPKNATNRRYVPRDTFALIMHKKTKLIIHASFEKDPLVKNLNGEEGSRLLGETKPTLEKYGVVSEQAAFKVVKANYNEVWETNFLISCFPVLKSFLKKVHDANQKGAMDKFAIDELLRKLDASITCVKDLDLFCNNKLFNASPDQKYAEANSFRQKLLKEQYFIDILVMILRELVTKKGVGNV